MDDRERNERQPVEEPAQGVGRGVRVGAYEGLRAGEAIVAVRERGLRPSLERVEGYAEARHGLVVSQEPQAGCEVAADSQVFLYIGAPARAVGLGPGEPVVEAEPAGVEAAGVEAAGEVGEPSVELDDPTVELGGVDEAELGVDEDELKHDPEPAEEPPRVWRGPALGSVQRRGFAENAGGWRSGGSSRSRAESRLAAVPAGVKVAAIGLLACAAITVLLSVAARLGGDGTVHRAPNAGAQTTSAASAPPAAQRAHHRPVAVAPKRVVPVGRREARRRGARERSARRGGHSAPVREVVRVVVVRSAGGPGGGAAVAVPSAREVRAAEDEHAEREFGP